MFFLALSHLRPKHAHFLQSLVAAHHLPRHCCMWRGWGAQEWPLGLFPCAHLPPGFHHVWVYMIMEFPNFQQISIFWIKEQRIRISRNSQVQSNLRKASILGAFSGPMYSMRLFWEVFKTLLLNKQATSIIFIRFTSRNGSYKYSLNMQIPKCYPFIFFNL